MSPFSYGALGLHSQHLHRRACRGAGDGVSEGAHDATGYWDALQLLAQQPQLPAFKALQSMLPRLAEQGQLLVLACALTQVCRLVPLSLTPKEMPEPCCASTESDHFNETVRLRV